MALETATYISDLVAANPGATDPKSQGDDHLRLLKSTIKATFPNITSALTSTQVELNYVTGVTSSVQTQINSEVATRLANDNTEISLRIAADLLLAPLAGAAFTGSVSFSAPVVHTNTVIVQAPTLPLQPATKQYVDASASIAGSVPVWVSGTSYLSGNTVYSPINYQTYRRITTGAGTTDPAYDRVNWIIVAGLILSSTSYFIGQF